MSRRKQPRGQAGRILGALWMPLVALIVIAVVGFGVNRIREKSQAISHPPTTRPIPATVVQINPKNVTYEVFGNLGTSGKVSYANLNSEPVDVVLTSLPWSVSETTTSSAVSLSLVAQVDGAAVACTVTAA
ncbi:MmpS family transport accessory protein [Mycobacteroides abscessus]|uniref:MmpS family transport accessory protein n=1 Tax=Mycobacteroides abscessus TaxID=36809 RepID=UPI0009C75C6A|nr:membrane protein MmpS [Mycobacteroides abscessus subsp. abscessus]